MGNTGCTVTSVTVGSQSSTLTYGTPASTTFKVSAVRGSNGTFNGTYSVTGLPAGVTSGFSPTTFTSTGSNPFPSTTLILTVPATLNAGSYPFTVFLSDGASSQASGNGTLVISKADPTVVVTPYSVTYDGNARKATYTITGVNGEIGATVGTVDVSATNHTNAGTYNGDDWSFTGTVNYNNTSGTVDDEIAKADEVIHVTPNDVTYDGNPHTATFTIKGVNDESGATVGTIDVSATTHTSAGTYNGDGWNFTGSANYKNSSGTVDDEIARRPITITPDPGQIKYCGQPDPTFTYYSSEALISGNSFTGALGRIGKNDVGTYPYTL